MVLHEYRQIATDDTLRETVSHGCGGYPFAYYLEDVWQFDFHRVDWHWHHEVEWITVAEGRLVCLVGKDRLELSAGEGMFVNSGVLHRYEAAGRRTVTPNIVFSPALFAPEESLIHEKYVLPVIRSAAAYQIFHPQIEWQGRILSILTEIYRLQERGGGNELQTVQMLLELWRILFDRLDRPSGDPGTAYAGRRQASLRQMMQYIHDYYREQILLDDIAASAAVSKSSALNIFRAGIHISPVSYLIQYRLKCAGKLLSTTEDPVSAIAEETGFSSAGYFCRKFREHYHMTPNEYRHMKKAVCQKSV